MALEPTTKDKNLIEVGTATQWFEDFVDSSQDSRDTSEQSRDYYDNKQYTQEELDTYEERNQPPVTKNRIKPKIDFMLGLERSERRDPRALPRNSQDIEGAQAATDSMRYVMDNTSFDVEKSLAFANLSIEGTCGIEKTVVEGKEGDKIIQLEHVSWDRLWYDPHSRRPDFKDAKYKGIIQWEDKDDVLVDFPDAEDALETMFSTAAETTTFEDAPRNDWVDSDRNRVRIARIWYRSAGQWYFGTFTALAWLEGPTLSPFIDQDGNTEDGLEMQSQFVTRENERYGTVWPLLSIQDAINFRESKFLHLMSVRQTYGTKDSGMDTEDIKTEMSKADGHIELPPGAKYGEKFGIIPTLDMADAQFTAMQESKNDIDSLGAAPALSGKGGATSGRELIARQQGGKMELGPAFEGLRQLEHRIYRWTWQRCKQFWTEPKEIRITDDPKNAKFVGLNKPITRLDVLEQQGVEITPAIANHPQASEVVGIQNNTAEIDVDVIIDDQPDTASLVGEQFDRLAGLYQANPQEIPFKVLLEASDLKNKDRLIEMIEEREKASGQSQEQQAQLQQQQIELTVKATIAEIQNTEADTAKKQSETAENIAGIQQGSQPTEGADPLDQAARLADLGNTEADTEKKQSEAFKNMTAGKENIAETVGIELDNRFQPVPTLAEAFNF